MSEKRRGIEPSDIKALMVCAGLIAGGLVGLNQYFQPHDLYRFYEVQSLLECTAPLMILGGATGIGMFIKSLKNR